MKHEAKPFENESLIIVFYEFKLNIHATSFTWILVTMIF